MEAISLSSFCMNVRNFFETDWLIRELNTSDEQCVAFLSNWMKTKFDFVFFHVCETGVSWQIGAKFNEALIT
jgi:hypothetical protein